MRPMNSGPSQRSAVTQGAKFTRRLGILAGALVLVPGILTLAVIAWMAHDASKALEEATAARYAAAPPPDQPTDQLTTEQREVQEGIRRRGVAGDISDSVAMSRLTLAMLQAAEECAKAGLPGAESRLSDMLDACTEAFARMPADAAPNTPGLLVAVREMRARYPKRPPATSTQEAPGSDGPQADPALPAWTDHSLSPAELRDATLIAKATTAWIRDDRSLTPRQADDLVLLAHAMAPRLAKLDGWDSMNPATRLAPLLALGNSEHPLAKLAMYQAMTDASWMEPRTEDIDRALSGLIAMQAPPRLCIAVAILTQRAHRPALAVKEKAAIESKACDVLVDYLAALGPCPADATLDEKVPWCTAGTIAVDLLDVVEPRTSSAALLRIEALPELDECLRQTILGGQATNRAWWVRGNGYADSVGESQWKEFHRELEKAYGHLSKARALDPARPEAAVRLIRVAMAGGAPQGETARMFLDRALKADVASVTAYRAAMWAARPRWGGSFRELLAIGMQAADTELFDTPVPALYADALGDLFEDGATLRVLADPEIGERLSSLVAGYTKSGWSEALPRLRAWAMLAALARGEYDEIIKVLADPTVPWDTTPFATVGIAPREMTFLAWARSGPTSDQVKAADALMANRKFDDAMQAYSRLLDQLKADGAPAQRVDAVEDLLANARNARGVSSGDWYQVPVNARMHGWRTKGGFWNSPMDAMAEGGGWGRPITARLLVPVGTTFEASVELLVWSRSDLMAESSLLFMMAPGVDARDCCSVSWYPNRGVIEIAQPDENPQIVRVATPAGASSDPMAMPIEVKADGAEISVRANGKLVHRSPVPGTGASLGRGLALGTVHPPAYGSKSGFRNLAVRSRASSDQGPSIGALP